MKIRNINELKNILDKSDRYAIVDIRTKEEFEKAHIPGSHNVPVDQITTGIPKFSNYETVYVHCGSGNRVKLAAELLRSLLPNNLQLIENCGFKNWRS